MADSVNQAKIMVYHLTISLFDQLTI